MAIIDIQDVLKQKRLDRIDHPGMKLVESLAPEEKSHLWDFIIELVKAEVGIGLGLVDVPEEDQDEVLESLAIYDVVSELYEEFNFGCYMCEDNDPNADPFRFDKHTICPVCTMKLGKIADEIARVNADADKAIGG